jgi:hypothetical protein
MPFSSSCLIPHERVQLIIAGYVAIILSIARLFQGGVGARPALATEPAAEVTDLKNLEQLKEVFQRDRGTVRLVTLLSPI